MLPVGMCTLLCSIIMASFVRVIIELSAIHLGQLIIALDGLTYALGFRFIRKTASTTTARRTCVDRF